MLDYQLDHIPLEEFFFAVKKGKRKLFKAEKRDFETNIRNLMKNQARERMPPPL